MSHTTWYEVVEIRCPECPAGIFLLETALVRAIRSLRASTRAADSLLLSCPECKTAFRYTHHNLRHRTTDARPHDPVCFAVPLGCGNNNCEPLEMVLIRNAGTNYRHCADESPSWRLDGIVCERGHQIAHPTADQVRALIWAPGDLRLV